MERKFFVNKYETEAGPIRNATTKMTPTDSKDNTVVTETAPINT